MKKTASRRRNKQQIKDDQRAAELKEQEIQAKIAKFDALYDEHMHLCKKVKAEDIIEAQIGNLIK